MGLLYDDVVHSQPALKTSGQILAFNGRRSWAAEVQHFVAADESSA